LYDEHVKNLKKMLAKEETQCRGYVKVVEEHRRKRVKILGCIMVFLWGLLSVLPLHLQ